ncbi:MAG: glycosyltransferase [Bacteroidales bacterium]|nr:glycosyltransferase [Bacteroidales bacterium]
MMEISVLMPVFNTDPEYLSGAIESILAQTYPHFEFLIYDDCSSRSDTLDTLEQYARRDERIRVIKGEKNVGPSTARNLLTNIASHPLCALMDSDDISHPRRFERQVEVFEMHPDMGVCGTWYHCFPSGMDVCHPVVPTYFDFMTMDCLGNPTVMFRKDLWLKYGLAFRADICMGEDYELFSRAIRYFKIANIPELLLDYRERPDSLSHQLPEALQRQDWMTRGAMLHYLSSETRLQNILSKMLSLPESEQIPNMFRRRPLKVPVSLGRRILSYFRLPVVVKLMGGLGNQMFQYAFGCALSEKLGRRVKFDFSWFAFAQKTVIDKESGRNASGLVIWKYGLGIFSKKIPVAGKCLSAVCKFFGGYVLEPEDICRKMDAKMLKPRCGGLWEGYFQDERYFRHLRAYLESVFILPDFPLDDVVNQKAKMHILLHDTSVFVHVRQGDFFTLGWQLPASYYGNAAAYMTAHLNNPRFFVFGDYVEEIMEAIRAHSSDVEWMGDYNSKNREDWKDQALMMCCRNAIIANSTFSWWAAWLGKAKYGIVTAPSPYVDGKDDGICERWVKISVNKDDTICGGLKK